MSTVIVNFHATEGNADNLANALNGALEHTRSLPDCSGATLHRNEDDPNHIMLLEYWTSSQAHKAYSQGLMDSGKVEGMMPMIESLNSVYFD